MKNALLLSYLRRKKMTKASFHLIIAQNLRLEGWGSIFPSATTWYKPFVASASHYISCWGCMLYPAAQHKAAQYTTLCTHSTDVHTSSVRKYQAPLLSLTEEATSSLSLSSTIKLHKSYFTNALQTDAAHVLFIMNKKWANCVNYNSLDVGITKDDWRSNWRSKKWFSTRCRLRQDRSSVSEQIPEDHVPLEFHWVWAPFLQGSLGREVLGPQERFLCHSIPAKLLPFPHSECTATQWELPLLWVPVQDISDVGIHG